MWGGVLGVLVGIMVGVYALPPILRHYYGEEKVAAGKKYEDSGTSISLVSLRQASDPLGEPAPGMRRFDFFASVAYVANNNISLSARAFSLEFEELEEWRVASSATSGGEPLVSLREFTEATIELHFIVEVPRADAEQITPRALHLSDPRVRFDIE
jgi:hypothetical protein